MQEFKDGPSEEAAEEKSEQNVEIFDSLSPEDIVDIAYEYWERLPGLAAMVPEDASEIEIKMIIRDEILATPNETNMTGVEATTQLLITWAAEAGIEEEIFEAMMEKNSNIESIKNPEHKK
ncbi:hypothetical protein A3F08_00065 [Candidatus Berkelbacteria bacterium RIFCSPHIGHO2_12_FULL_36_9]|uniref:Uncharacterized protein n=1 Tax=Candidatus Berkelbacteria bacterium RIFCSPHIGHO2_12_FULL_36_9 TaxID=1797469 RepID=A0A1F5EES3_9BACT|nr:MAG: hypothetical protein A3F08_00065 [Candidatus Berkelbacteria bacterium RIFCSPHIGHO2_12_FULL_36_9]